MAVCVGGKMKLYYFKESNRYHALRQSLIDNQVPHTAVRLNNITSQFIINLLTKCPNGYEDLLVKGEESDRLMDQMTVKELAQHLAYHKELIKPMFCVGDNKIITGKKPIEEYRAL
jgi:arsenate reductase-like glutaredoxin family protein